MEESFVSLKRWIQIHSQEFQKKRKKRERESKGEEEMKDKSENKSIENVSIKWILLVFSDIKGSLVVHISLVIFDFLSY